MKREELIAQIEDPRNDIFLGEGKPLEITRLASEVWASIPQDYHIFFDLYPYLSWGEGSVGGRICMVSEHPNKKKIIKIDSNLKDGIVIGSDEADIFVMVQKDSRVWSVDLFMKQVTTEVNLYDLVSSYIYLDE